LIRPHKNAKPNKTGRRNPNDLAILILNKPIPNGAQIFEVNHELGWEKRVITVAVAGYGSTGASLDKNGNTSAEGSKELRNAFLQTIPSDDPQYFALDTSKAGPCVGDSGGAIYFSKNNRLLLAGIIALNDAPDKAKERCHWTA